MRYLITFACYGAHMHGDGEGSVDRRHNLPGSRLLHEQPGRLKAEYELMDQLPYTLTAQNRDIVLSTIQEVCQHRGWALLAAHVRTNHVHAVLEAEALPEKVLSDFKVYSSRKLNEVESGDRKHWARHGSTRWLWKDDEVRAAMKYVIEKQGEPMAAFSVKWV